MDINFGHVSVHPLIPVSNIFLLYIALIPLFNCCITYRTLFFYILHPLFTSNSLNPHLSPEWRVQICLLNKDSVIRSRFSYWEGQCVQTTNSGSSMTARSSSDLWNTTIHIQWAETLFPFANTEVWKVEQKRCNVIYSVSMICILYSKMWLLLKNIRSKCNNNISKRSWWMNSRQIW